MTRIICFSVFCIVLFSCRKPPLSAKEMMNHYKFTSLRPGAGSGDYFAISDTIHREYVNGATYTTSRVDWLPGNRVNLIFTYLTEELSGKLFSLGDTVKVEIVSLDKDTLSMRVNFKDYPTSSVFRYLRGPLVK